MKDIKYCSEYIIGCCLYEEFYVENVCKKCPFIHNEDLRSEYLAGNYKLVDEKRSYKLYKEVIKSVEQKIITNRDYILNMSKNENLNETIEYTENKINQLELDCDSMQIYKLLKIHGDLIKEAQKESKENKYSVCSNCSAIKIDGECKHGFCKVYKKIRKIITELKIRNNFINS